MGTGAFARPANRTEACCFLDAPIVPPAREAQVVREGNFCSTIPYYQQGQPGRISYVLQLLRQGDPR
jgi:hypothetical protein